MAMYPCLFGGSGGGIPAQLQTDMDSVFNKKLGTSTTYPSNTWAKEVNLMGLLPEKTISGSVVSFADGADDVPIKEGKFYFNATQESGTPTPSDPKAITGVTGLTETQTDGQTPPVTSQTYVFTFGGTYYGGYVLVKADGSVELWKTLEIVDLGDLTWNYNATQKFFYAALAVKQIAQTDMASGMCTIYQPDTFYNAYRDNNNYRFAYGASAYANTLVITNNDYTDKDAFKTAMDGISLVYELATPVKVADLSPVEINTLLGVNNFFGDGNGDSEVIYHVNTNPTANLWGGLQMAEDISKNVSLGYVYQKGNETTIVSNDSALNGKIVLDSSFGFKANTQYTLILSIKNTTTYNNNIYANLLIWYTDGTTTSSATSGTANTKKTYAIVTDANKTIDRIEARAQSGQATIYLDECGLFEGVKTVDDFVPYNRYLGD